MMTVLEKMAGSFWQAGFLFVLLQGAQVRAQNDSLPPAGVRNSYRPNDFIAPLPGRLVLNANFAEFRGDHFHSGIDISTGGQTGLGVHAVARGYVSRIKIASGGYGQALYITHPGGFVSVYGHLDAYAGRIASWLRELQYKNQTYELDVSLQPIQLPVSQGELVAWSGNTGFSGGPHLHYEIRDEKTEEIINPLLASLTLPDHSPPRIKAITLFSYEVHGGITQIEPLQTIPAREMAPGRFTLLHPVQAGLPARVILGVIADDLEDAGKKYRGVFGIRLRKNGSLVYESFFERFAFDQTRSINSYLDYPLSAGKTFVQRSYTEPGNRVSLYGRVADRGIIHTAGQAPGKFRYEVYDAAGNSSVLEFTLPAGPRSEDARQVQPGRNSPLAAFVSFDLPAQIGFLPEGNTAKPEQAPFSAYFPAGSLFDNLLISARRSDGKWSFGNKKIAIRDSVLISFELPEGMQGLKAIVYREGVKPLHTLFAGGRVQAWIKEFGNFSVREDLNAPVVRLLAFAGMSRARNPVIKVYAQDSGSGILHYEGRINGDWVMFRYDQKNNLLWYPFDKKLEPGLHLLQLKVSDRAGNESLLEKHFRI